MDILIELIGIEGENKALVNELTNVTDAIRSLLLQGIRSRYFRVSNTTAIKAVENDGDIVACREKDLAQLTYKEVYEHGNGLHIFILSNEQTELAWVFVFPKTGYLVTTAHAALWRVNNFEIRKTRLNNLVIEKNGRKMLMPNVIMSNNEFSVLATPDDNLLFCGNSNTSVVTQ